MLDERKYKLCRNQIKELRNVNEASCWVIIGRSRHLNEMEKKSLIHKNC